VLPRPLSWKRGGVPERERDRREGKRKEGKGSEEKARGDKGKERGGKVEGRERRKEGWRRGREGRGRTNEPPLSKSWIRRWHSFGRCSNIATTQGLLVVLPIIQYYSIVVRSNYPPVAYKVYTENN